MKANPTQELLDRRVADVAFDHECRRLNSRDKIPELRSRQIRKAVKEMGL